MDYIDHMISMRLHDSPAKGQHEDFWYHSDDLHSTMVVTDAAASVVERYEYADYGAPTILEPDNVTVRGSSIVGNAFLFTGRYYDTETNLYYYRTRYLEPQWGRFTTRDTIGVWGDAANVGNGLAYVSNNPLFYLDPFGKEGNWGTPGNQGGKRKSPKQKNRGGKKNYKHKPSFNKNIERGIKWLEDLQKSKLGKALGRLNMLRCLLNCMQRADDCYRRVDDSFRSCVNEAFCAGSPSRSPSDCMRDAALGNAGCAGGLTACIGGCLAPNFWLGLAIDRGLKRLGF